MNKNTKNSLKKPKVRKRWIKAILEQNKKMDLLVKRLLDLSRIERRDHLANIEILKILPIIKNALKVPTHNRLIVSKNITINLDDIEKKNHSLLLKKYS